MNTHTEAASQAGGGGSVPSTVLAQRGLRSDLLPFFSVAYYASLIFYGMHAGIQYAQWQSLAWHPACHVAISTSCLHPACPSPNIIFALLNYP